MQKEDFNLEKYKTGKYDLVTNNGQKVIYFHYMDINIPYPVIILLEGDEFFMHLTKDAKATRTSISPFLKMVPKEKISALYVNVYKDTVVYHTIH